MINQTLDGRYRLDALIGEGGMGRVYQAEQLRVGRSVAVKLIREERAVSANSIRRFIEEARACSALQHPNVVTVHDFGQTGDGTLYLVMELLRGQLLSSAIRNGEIDARRAVTVGIQLCSGLAAAHALGMVHQDLKPANVMICQREGVGELVKILDFGVVGLVDELRQAGRIQGSPSYMSPEQSRSKPVDTRTDIYALGCVLYEMLTGQPPFEGEVKAVLRQHREASPRALPPQVPEALSQLVMACLAKRREERPRDVALIRQSLEAVLMSLEDSGLTGAAGRDVVEQTADGTWDIEVVSTTNSWIAEAPGDTLPGMPALVVEQALISLPTRSVLAVRDASTDEALRVRRLVLDKRVGRWSVELALESWFRPMVLLKTPAVAVWRRVWWVGEVLYLAGDTPSGETLDVTLHREGSLSLDRMLSAARRICEGLSALHGLELPHGDLRPGAVHLRSDGVTLADPSLWSLVERGVAALSVEAVTLASRYKAPEQFKAMGVQVGVGADLYALGCVLYEMLSGRPPFLQDTPETLLAAKQRADYPPLAELESGLPRAVEALIDALLRPSPEDRPRSVSVVMRALEELDTVAVDDTGAVTGQFFRLNARGRLLAREDEQRVLEEALGDARAGHGRLVVIQGPTGIGRTRLLEAALASARREGALVLRCRGRADRQDEPFMGARALCLGLDGALSLTSAEERTAVLTAIRAEGGNHGGSLRGLAPLLEELFADIPPTDGEHDQTTRALLALALALAQPPRLLVLAVDDLHWLDGGTLRWLERLTLMIPRLSALVVLTAIDGCEEPVLTAPTATRLTPGALSVSAVRALLGERLGEHRELEAIAEALFARSAGNPGLLFEVLREGVRRGAFRWGDTGWGVSRALLEDIPLAETIFERAVTELKALPPSEQETLAAAAIWGTTVDVEALQVLIPDGKVGPPLAAAARAGVLQAQDDKRWGFRHETLRAAAESLVLPSERERLHRVAASWLVDTGGSATTVAHHLLSAAPEPQDLMWFRRAADAALSVGDGSTATRFARAALARGSEAEEVPDQQVLARALELDGEVLEAVLLYERLLQSALTPEQRVAVLTTYSRLQMERGQLAATLAMQDDALAELGWRPGGALNGLVWVVRALVTERLTGPVPTESQLNTNTYHLSELLLLRAATLMLIAPRESVRVLLEGYVIARRCGAQYLYSRALSTFSIICSQGLGWRAPAERLALAAVEHATQSRNAESRCVAHVVNLNQQMVFGQLEVLGPEVTEAEALVYRLGKSGQLTLLISTRVQAAMMRGDLDRVAEIALQHHDFRVRSMRDALAPGAALGVLSCLIVLRDSTPLLPLIDSFKARESTKQHIAFLHWINSIRTIVLIRERDWEAALSMSRALRTQRRVRGRWVTARLLLTLGIQFLNSVQEGAVPADQMPQVNAEVRALYRRARRAARSYPATRLMAAFIQARLSLLDGKTGRALAQLQRSLPEARGALTSHRVVVTQLLVMAGMLQGGQQSPDGQRLLDEAREALSGIHPAHLVVHQLAPLVGHTPPADAGSGLLKRLTPILVSLKS